MYDTPKFLKLAFLLHNTNKFIFKMSILFDKSHFKEGNFFCGPLGTLVACTLCHKHDLKKWLQFPILRTAHRNTALQLA